MTTTLLIGILLAVLCAAVSNYGFLVKHRGACEAPDVAISTPLRSAKGLFQSKFFVIGLGIGFVGWLLHIVALGVGPTSTVQAVLAGGVVLLAVMAERFFGLEVGSRQWWGVALTTFGLLLLAITVPAGGHEGSGYSITGMIAFESAALGIGILLMIGPRFGGHHEHHGIMLALASGVIFGVSDIGAAATFMSLGPEGAGAFISPWVLVALSGAVIGFYSSARSFQLGQAVPVIAVTGAAANVTIIAGGFIVFGDPLPSSALGIVLQSFAFVLVIVAAMLTPAPVRAAEPVTA